MLQLEDYAVTEAVAKNRTGLAEEKQIAKTKVKADKDALELSHTPKKTERGTSGIFLLYIPVKRKISSH